MQELVANAKARVAKDLSSWEHNRPGLREQYELQLNTLEDDRVPDAEIIVAPFGYPTITGACADHGQASDWCCVYC